MAFKKGQSGNPKGRPPGTGANARLRQAIEGHLPEIIESMVGAAKAGDVQAARVLLDRALPALRPVDTPARLSFGTGSADLADASKAVLEALTVGSLTPDQAGTVTGVLAALARIGEATELEERVRALENRV